ncbi:MAG TPA: nicotinate-nucleotide adenylyltransferase [Acidimicrobiales bacterium]|nr:nicotinate-nucleotide adenylyltransferase [Acidimicrobiales bacterium]
MPLRLGIFGGTFDPPHIAHIVAASWAREVAALDTVLLMVAHDQWQKAGAIVASAADRLAMVRAAVHGIDGLEASDVEIARGGPTYTADTLEQLAIDHPGAELVLILGADAAGRVQTWVRFDDTPALAALAVVTRAGEAPPAVAGWPQWTLVEIPSLDVSSSMVRRRLAEGRSIDGLVPPAVVRSIAERGLYA